ncbi:C45 family autoproteolytic acyltransferase/hydrolase [candidate division KSB1 bacterium]
MKKKIKRREFFKQSLGSILLLSGMNRANSSISITESGKTEENTDEKYIWIETSGSPGEIGYQYGKKVKDRLSKHCENRTSNIYERFKRDVVAEGKKVMLGVMERKFPYIVEEMRGIAEGSGINYDDYSLNVISSGFSVFKEDSDSCSDIMFKESDYGAVLGKTLDATTPNAVTPVIRLIKPENGITVLCVTRIDGISTETGLNNRGLALGESSIHFFTTNPRGVVRNLLLRPLLSECSNVKEGIQFLSENPTITGGFNYSMVDLGGNAAVVERSPTECYSRRTDGKVIFATNHTATPCMRKLERSRGEIGDKNSDDRFANLKKITSAEDFELSLISMKNILSNHNNPGAICQHGTYLYTQRAYINLAAEGKLLAAFGNPCKNDFIEFAIS